MQRPEKCQPRLWRYFAHPSFLIQRFTARLIRTGAFFLTAFVIISVYLRALIVRALTLRVNTNGPDAPPRRLSNDPGVVLAA